MPDVTTYENKNWQVFGIPVIEVASPLTTGVGEWVAQAEANAALIASAPRLKRENEALRQMLENILQQENGHGDIVMSKDGKVITEIKELLNRK